MRTMQGRQAPAPTNIKILSSPSVFFAFSAAEYPEFTSTKADSRSQLSSSPQSTFSISAPWEFLYSYLATTVVLNVVYWQFIEGVAHSETWIL